MRPLGMAHSAVGRLGADPGSVSAPAIAGRNRSLPGASPPPEARRIDPHVVCELARGPAEDDDVHYDHSVLLHGDGIYPDLWQRGASAGGHRHTHRDPLRGRDQFCVAAGLGRALRSRRPPAHPDRLHAEVRATGFSLAYSLGTALFGGFTPAICTFLIHITRNPAIPGAWLSLAALCGLTAAMVLSPMRWGKSRYM